MDKKVLIAIAAVVLVIIAVAFTMGGEKGGMPSTDNYSGHGHAH